MNEIRPTNEETPLHFLTSAGFDAKNLELCEPDPSIVEFQTGKPLATYRMNLGRASYLLLVCFATGIAATFSGDVVIHEPDQRPELEVVAERLGHDLRSLNDLDNPDDLMLHEIRVAWNSDSATLLMESVGSVIECAEIANKLQEKVA